MVNDEHIGVSWETHFLFIQALLSGLLILSPSPTVLRAAFAVQTQSTQSTQSTAVCIRRVVVSLPTPAPPPRTQRFHLPNDFTTTQLQSARILLNLDRQLLLRELDQG